jgi:hypothetical protein
MNDFEALIKHSHKMAEQLLLEQNGEFYPFAASIGMDGKITPLALYLGDEFPASDSMITGFQNLLKQRIQENCIRAYAITFDCMVKRNDDAVKTNALAMECFSIANNQLVTFYFIYKLVNKQLEIGDAWRVNGS